MLMKKHKCDRRQFLQGTLATGGGLAALTGLGSLSNLALAAQSGITHADRYFVFCYFSGGWDVLLSLDPRDPIQFNEGNKAKTRIQPGYHLLDDDGNDGSLIVSNAGITFGPYIGNLQKYAGDMSVIRGMSMDTLTHEVGRRRFITCKPPSGLLARGSSGATWLASKLGQFEAIPNLSVRVESYNVDQPNYATGLKVASVPDLVRALKKSEPQMEASLDAQLDGLLTQFSQCQAAQKSATWQTAESSRQKSREMVSSGYDKLFDFQAKTPGMEILRDHYGIGASGNAALQSPEAQAAVAATALMSGISRVASIQVASGIDAHYDDWATDHGPAQQRGFNAICALADDLAGRQYKNSGTTWLDHTTIVGFSEFQRTALLNTRGGRDHSLTNACFVMGAGIKGGNVVGGSSDVGMEPMRTNLNTGQHDPGGEFVYPEHILQALMVDLGIEGDPVDLCCDPFNAILKKP
ncbi:MAG TPA: DUF1501 domain-containing protein [Myxococcales bacterium]|nr:DUF1501 domain-containing protein [Myxococcales bacterium]